MSKNCIKIDRLYGSGITSLLQSVPTSEDYNWTAFYFLLGCGCVSVPSLKDKREAAEQNKLCAFASSSEVQLG